eukprot:4697602-Ditylum_brightwellii.AAC.1
MTGNVPRGWEEDQLLIVLNQKARKFLLRENHMGMRLLRNQDENNRGRQPPQQQQQQQQRHNYHNGGNGGHLNNP